MVQYHKDGGGSILFQAGKRLERLDDFKQAAKNHNGSKEICSNGPVKVQTKSI